MGQDMTSVHQTSGTAFLSLPQQSTDHCQVGSVRNEVKTEESKPQLCVFVNVYVGEKMPLNDICAHPQQMFEV